MCNVHFMRAVLKNIPKKDKREVAYMLKDALEDESKMQELAGIYPWRSELNQDTGPLRIYSKRGTLP